MAIIPMYKFLEADELRMVRKYLEDRYPKEFKIPGHIVVFRDTYAPKEEAYKKERQLAKDGLARKIYAARVELKGEVFYAMVSGFNPHEIDKKRMLTFV